VPSTEMETGTVPIAGLTTTVGGESAGTAAQSKDQWELMVTDPCLVQEPDQQQPRESSPSRRGCKERGRDKQGGRLRRLLEGCKV
jgi:hypothetical protein